MAGCAARLVGREPELATAEEAVGVLCGGHRAPILEIAGEPGIGKTRLLAELRIAAGARGCLVLTGRAAEFETDVPFAICIDALDDYLVALGPDGLPEVDPEWLPELATVFSAFVPLAGDRQAALQAERHRTYRAVRALLEALGRRQPLVLALDDVHWADPASAELLAYLLAHPVGAPVLLVLAFRPVPTPARLATALAAAVRNGDARRLDVGPLSQSEADELAGSSLDAETRVALYRESGGNPFYLEQLARTVGSNAAAPRQAGLGPGEGSVPAAVAAALVSELQSLPASALALLEGAAVAGDPFDDELAARTGGLLGAEALELLDTLLRCDLVRPTPVPRRFHFRHPIVRRTVYESTGAGWRVGAHARAASALAEAGTAAPGVAHHVERSAKPGDEAAIATLIAAGQAVAPRAPDTAAHWYGAAMRLLVPGDSRRLELLVARATALGAAGDLEESHADLCRALELLPSDAGLVRVQVVSFCAAVEALLGRHQQAKARLLQGLTQLSGQSSREAALLELELSAGSTWANDFVRARDYAAQALAIGRSLGEKAIQAHAGGQLVVAEYSMARTAEALDRLPEVTALLDGLDADALAQHISAAFWVAWAEVMLERYDDAIRHCEHAIALCRATGQGHYLVPIMWSEVHACVSSGRLTKASELAATAVESSALAGHAQALSNAYLYSCWAAALRGDFDRALQAGAKAVEVAQPIDESVLKAASSVAYGMALIEAGHAQQGRDELMKGTGGPDLPFLGRVVRCLTYEALTRASLTLGDVEEAGRWADRAEAATDGFSLPVEAAAARRARARLMMARDQPDPAADLVLCAAERADAGGSPLEAARCRLLAGRALVKAGQRERALAELEAAETVLVSCGATGFAHQAAAELRRLGRRRVRASRGSLTGIEALTEREHEIAGLLAAGKTNREVAAACYLSEKTVEGHVSRIFTKLGVSTRAAVAGLVSRERGGPGSSSGMET